MDSRIKEKLFEYGAFPLSLSYLSTQKRFYENCEGLVAHEIKGQYFIVAGEPVIWGSHSDFFKRLLDDLNSKGLLMCGYYVSQGFKESIKSLFGDTLEFEKCGTSSIIDIRSWDLNNPESSEARRALSHSNRQDFEIQYYVGAQDCAELKESLQKCYSSWRETKGRLDIKFLVSSDLPNPSHWNSYEEWYVCRHEEQIIAYLSWLPYGRKGRYLNQMIQNPQGHRFGLDALIAQSLCDFKKRNLAEVSLGLNPFNTLDLQLNLGGLFKLASYFLPNYSSTGLAYYKSKFGNTKQLPRFIFWEREKGFIPASIAMTRASFDLYKGSLNEL